jgi:hypothetical protein
MLTQRLAQILDLQAAAGPALTGSLHELAGFEAIDQGDGNPNWCWAAVAAMAYRHYSGISLGPCDWASICLDPKKCCQRPGSCNTTLPILDALRGMLALRPPVGPLAAEEIRQEIDAPVGAGVQGRPIVCVQRISAHVVVIYGIDMTDPGQTLVLYVDPMGGYLSKKDLQDFTVEDPGWVWTVFTQTGGI